MFVKGDDGDDDAAAGLIEWEQLCLLIIDFRQKRDQQRDRCRAVVNNRCHRRLIIIECVNFSSWSFPCIVPEKAS